MKNRLKGKKNLQVLKPRKWIIEKSGAYLSRFSYTRKAHQHN